MRNYSKNETEALSVFDDIIQLDPESDFAIRAQEKIDKINDTPDPAPQAEPEGEPVDQAQLEFGAKNYPNPANPGTSIKYVLPEDGHVNITIVNIMGHTVMELENRFQQAGRHTVLWDGRNNSGSIAATGLYFYRIAYKDQVLVNKFLLIK